MLGFDLDNERFSWGLKISQDGDEFRGQPFDPNSGTGPVPGNELHLNNVYCDESGMYVSGLRTGAVLIFNGSTITKWANLPLGAHNARPYCDGLLFNDTQANNVRYAKTDKHYDFKIPTYPEEKLTHTNMDDTQVARQGFGRGLCVLDKGIIATGSSPSTVTLHDIDNLKTLSAITLTYDIRNAIHGLEVWPYD